MIAPNRPRAAHKLNLQDGDRVKLVGWQDNKTSCVGNVYTFIDGWLVDVFGIQMHIVPSVFPKGERSLFIVVFRANSPVPDEVIVLTGWQDDDMSSWIMAQDMSSEFDTCRMTLTFPAGSNIGTVVREEL